MTRSHKAPEHKPGVAGARGDELDELDPVVRARTKALQRGPHVAGAGRMVAATRRRTLPHTRQHRAPPGAHLARLATNAA